MTTQIKEPEIFNDTFTQEVRTRFGLTEKQANLAIEYAYHGNLEKAAELADVDYRYAKRLKARNRQWLDALVYVMGVIGLGDTALGYKVVRHIAEHGEHDSDKLRAAQYLIERGLGKVPETHLHAHKLIPANTNPQATLQRIVELAAVLGMSPAALGLPAPTTEPHTAEPTAPDEEIIDAEYTDPQAS